MAPAALLSPVGTVQSACSTSNSTSKWPKRGLASGSLLSRSPSRVNMQNASLKSSTLYPLDTIFGSRGRSGSRPNSRSVSSRRVFTSAVEGSVAVEEPSAESPAESIQDGEESAVPSQVKTEKYKPRVPGQKLRREEVTVPAEAVVPGAVFTGKVTTIQPFGAFVNFGAFTDGLVHISKLRSGYVSNVADVVSLGQEVSVTVINVEQTSGRIALSMIDEKEAKEQASRQGEGREGGARLQQGSDGKPLNRGKVGGGGRPPRRDEPKKPPTKLVKGQEVEGTVKNKIRSGMFVELPEEEEGFLRYSDVPGGENMAPEQSLQPGQKIKATVLKIDRGRIVLTMKPIVDINSVNRDINKGESGGSATNPFEIAFRALNLVLEPTIAVDEAPAADEEVVPEVTAAVEEAEAPAVEEEVVPEITAAVEVAPTAAEEVVSEVTVGVEEAPPALDDEVPEVTAAVEEASSAAEEEIVPEVTAGIEEETSTEEVIPEAIAAVEETPAVEEDVAQEVTDAPVVEDVTFAVEEPFVVEEGAVPEVMAAVEEIPTVEETIPEPTAAVAPVAEESVAETAGAVEETPVAEEEAMPESVLDAAATVEEGPGIKEAIPGTYSAAEDAPAPVEQVITDVPTVLPIETTKVEKKHEGVSAALVKELRDETGAGMMDCKRALAETGGDLEKARETLRKKGLASADKKASRVASEGLVGSYIHDSRIGVLVEVNCETDFVSRGPVFKSLVEDMGMQVVASQQVKYISVDDIPADVVAKEKEIESQREDLANKPIPMRAKIVEGRVSKRLNEFALLEQAYIRDDKILVKDLVKQTVATLGENIKVRRFERYILGEGLEKKSTDFAAEVAAQTAVKVPAESTKAEVTMVPAADDIPAAPTVVVSAALVKQLRDQTGAGMMDCKKALSATENDLEKAIDFLRMKGLASAEKKASRLASEGLIGTYIHDGRIGVLIEVNCETDFVARGDKFKELVEDLAMQVAAYPLVQVVGVEDVPEEVVTKEKEIESGKEDLANKPEAIRSRIVEGRIGKRLAELALLEQPFIKDDKKLVKDIVKETVAALGENIQVRRFTRFNLGEGIEKKVVDFAAEVAAQTGVTV